ncbi:hypothetical protein GJZ31_04700 [Salmonella enterica]|nr:hypothetical protein [Salmonella enterica]
MAEMMLKSMSNGYYGVSSHGSSNPTGLESSAVGTNPPLWSKLPFSFNPYSSEPVKGLPLEIKVENMAEFCAGVVNKWGGRPFPLGVKPTVTLTIGRSPGASQYGNLRRWYEFETTATVTAPFQISVKPTTLAFPTRHMGGEATLPLMVEITNGVPARTWVTFSYLSHAGGPEVVTVNGNKLPYSAMASITRPNEGLTYNIGVSSPVAGTLSGNLTITASVI